MNTMMPREAPAVKPKPRRTVRWLYTLEGRGGACGLLLLDDGRDRWHFGVCPVPGTDSYELSRCEPGEGVRRFTVDVRGKRCGCRIGARPPAGPCEHVAMMLALRAKGELPQPATK